MSSFLNNLLRAFMLHLDKLEDSKVSCCLTKDGFKKNKKKR